MKIVLLNDLMVGDIFYYKVNNGINSIRHESYIIINKDNNKITSQKFYKIGNKHSIFLDKIIYDTNDLYYEVFIDDKNEFVIEEDVLKYQKILERKEKFKKIYGR